MHCRNSPTALLIFPSVSIFHSFLGTQERNKQRKYEIKSLKVNKVMIPGDHTCRNKYANKENVVPAIGGFIIQGKRDNVGERDSTQAKQ